jgi:hypothetical protein
MPRSGSSYGVPGYRRGTGLKVGRSARRRRSFWRTYVATPILALIVLGAAGLVVSVALNLATSPSPARQAVGGASPSHARGQAGTGGGAGSTAHGKSTPSVTASSPGQGGARAAAGGKTRSGARGARTDTGVRTGAVSASAKTGKTGKRGRNGAAAGARGRAGPAAFRHGGAVVLLRVQPGVETYAAAHGPVVATLRVAWLSWVRVIADGKLTFLHEEPRGYIATFRARHSLDVYLGYPQGSQLTVNGQPLGPFANRGTLWVDVTSGAGG